MEARGGGVETPIAEIARDRKTQDLTTDKHGYHGSESGLEIAEVHANLGYLGMNWDE